MASGCGKRVLLIGGVSLAVGVGVAWGGALSVDVPLPGAIPAAPGEWIGAVHVHTDASDGSGTLKQVVLAAEEAGLDFVVVTDHNVRAAAESRYFDDVFALIGEEVSAYDGHLLVLGAGENWRQHGTKRTDEIMALSAERGARRVIAHPFHERRAWQGNTDAFEAIEIWNADTDWRNDTVWDWARAIAVSPVNQDYGLLMMVDRPERNLDWWDQQLMRRRVGGICSVDAHARIPIALGLAAPYPSYRRMFGMMRQHVLLDTGPGSGGLPPDRAETQLLSALTSGRGWCSLDMLADGSGLIVRASKSGVHDGVGPGGWLKWSSDTRMHVILPPAGKGARIQLMRDGGIAETADGRTMDVDLPGPGVYRIEASLPIPGVLGGGQWVPWILTGPIYVTTQEP